MNKSILLNLGLAGCVLGVIAGCASTKVTMTSEYNGPLPKPGHILVCNCAVSPDEVGLDRGLSARLEEMASLGLRFEALTVAVQPAINSI